MRDGILGLLLLAVLHATYARTSPSSSVLALSPLILATDPLVSLTFTSIGLNPSSEPSRWVVSAFNDSAARAHFAPPPLNADLYACSIEMLAILWSQPDRSFYGGNCSLTLSRLSEEVSVRCVYRGMFEHWRQARHYSLAFFCPVASERECAVLERQSDHSLGPVQSRVEGVFQPVNRSATASFLAHIPRISLVSEQIKPSRGNQVLHKSAPSIRAGVCAVLPYASGRSSSRRIHRRILQDWVVYYSALDMDVFLYDRQQRHWDASFPSSAHLHYFNFSIGEHAAPTQLVSSSNSGLESSNFHSDELYLSDEDKVMTLNHCRFEARAMHGVDVVLVADVDEFLYCKGDDSAPQKRVVHDVLQYFASTTLDEVGFDQLFPSSLASDFRGLRRCLLRSAKLNQCAFQCYASIDFPVDIFIEKTIYLGLNCPITGYHRGCPEHDYPGVVKLGLCGMCSSGASDRCYLVHLSNRADLYTSAALTKYRVPNVSAEEERTFLRSKLELKKVLRFTSV